MANHPAWQLGHLAQTADRVIPLAGGESILGESRAKRFAHLHTYTPLHSYPLAALAIRPPGRYNAPLWASAKNRTTPEHRWGLLDIAGEAH